MADVFLSYKREDAARVRKLVTALRGTGLDVWWDEDIPPSAPWETTIEKALAEAKTVIVCWSPASVASENVRSEARVAREDGRLIQVFVRPCSPPLFFGERQGIDLSDWRGRADDPRIATVADSVWGVTGKRPRGGGDEPRPRRWFEFRLHVALAAILLLVGSLAGWWLLSPAKASGPMTLAVLPFRALNPADADLVDAIWDDTRSAISRNPNLRVLGRQAMQVLAKKDLEPVDYRRKVGADFLLDGSVQHVGDDVRIKLSLTRASDGTEVWGDEIGGKLDDVFAFQTRIANEVEGRIRGRVAPGGGATAQNIATTGQVYSLYAEAGAKIRKRDPDSAREAAVILRHALAIDPNYAPAWADLGVATIFGARSQESAAGPRAAATADLKRALTLAPNLGYAHAALAMVQNLQPDSEPDLRRAVALDPGNAEAWIWLGNLLVFQNRMKEALAAHSRAVEIEPLLWLAIGNRISDLLALGDRAGLAREMTRIEGLQDEVLLAKARWRITTDNGHPGDGINILLQLRARHPEEAAAVDQRVAFPLIELGFIDEGLRARNAPELAPEYRGIPLSAKQLDDRYRKPEDFWQDSETAALYGRLLPARGRLNEYVARYRAAFKTPDDFFAAFAQRLGVLLRNAPTVAANLRAGGDAADADAILRRTEPTVIQSFRNGPAQPGILAMLAFYRSADGRDDEAISLLQRATAGGWLPYGANDLAQEPAFARLVSRPDFQAVRVRILARIEQERRKVSVVELARAGYAPRAV